MNLTRDERRVLAFLVGALFLGALLQWLKPRPSWDSRFLTRGGPPPSTATAPRTELLSLNTATAEELERLPGIGPVLAARIVAFREKRGPFRSWQELLEVPGIGERLLARIQPSLKGLPAASGERVVPGPHTGRPVLDLNRASREELEAIPEVGPELATRILAFRRTRGRFASVEELRQIPGIGDKRYQVLQAYFWVDFDPARRPP